MEQDVKTYSVRRTNEPIEITGDGTNAAWKTADLLTDFTCPWEEIAPQFTSFRSMHDTNWVYFLFDVEDHNINVFVNSNDKREALQSDRVELFFRKDESMKPYYCLEIDPLGRVFDLRSTFYRQFETDWSWPNGELMVKARRKQNGYSVELKISKQSLLALGVLNGNIIQAGIFRADCMELRTDDSSFRWISWLDPGSETPDFHLPKAFGLLALES